MSKLIVAIFENEQAAHEGLGVLQNRHEEGAIALFSNAILVKDEEGHVDIGQVADTGAEGLTAGLLLGSALGILAGPLGAIAGASAGAVAALSLGGAALGASVGGAAGSLADLDEAEVDVYFLQRVAESLEHGKVALLADLFMDPDDGLQEQIEALGGEFHAYLRDEVYEELYVIRAEAYNAELDELQEEWRNSAGEARDQAAEKISTARGKLRSLHEDTENRLRLNQKRFDVRIAVLRDQVSSAKEERKSQLERRIEAIREDFALRNSKLRQAWSLTGEALAPKKASAA